MSSWLNNIKSQMYQYNSNLTNSDNKYEKVSEYILKQGPLNNLLINDYGDLTYLNDKFVVIMTDKEVFKIRRDRIFTFTKYHNDCLELKINKHFSKFLNLEEVNSIEYLNEED